MSRLRFLLLVYLAGLAAAAQAQPQYPAVPAGRAALPAQAMPLRFPKDAEKTLKVQTVSRFTAMSAGRDAKFWAVSDGGEDVGAGARLLALHHVHVDWILGRVKLLGSSFLQDPDRKLPFPLVNEARRPRYLTASDLAIRSVQVAAGAAWLADELGPYLVRADLKGKVLAVHDVRRAGRALGSADELRLHALAASADGWRLFALLAQAGAPAAEIVEFDAITARWTGRAWAYPLDAAGARLGGFNLIDDSTVLIVEGGRLYKASLAERDAQGFMRKLGYVDFAALKATVLVRDADVVDWQHIAAGNGRELVLLRAPEFLGAW